MAKLLKKSKGAAKQALFNRLKKGKAAPAEEKGEKEEESAEEKGFPMLKRVAERVKAAKK